MNLTYEDMKQENEHLSDTIRVIRNQMSSLGQELYDDDSKIKEFKKYIWDSKAEFDPTELRSMMAESDLDVYLMTKKGKYFQNLYKIQNNPYFGRIKFENDDGFLEDVYIGITHVINNKDYLVNDWRSPICSLFYDYEVGSASYLAPSGVISGKLSLKRQYNIKDGKFVHIFDNSINIDDELLQQVLSEHSNDKMKNIVNTIQMEQNKVIRNTDDRHLIVQGIAGSGKTSVALHRIAFLLYKIKNLSSNNVLIFSPNKVFSTYISNVLPELGEDNTLETTFHSFLLSNLKEYKSVESFTDFIARYYKYVEKDKDLVKYKQSDDIVYDIEDYVSSLDGNLCINSDISFDIHTFYSKEELNDMFHNRYSKFPIFSRIEAMAVKISEMEFNGNKTKVKSIRKKILDSLNIGSDYRKLYTDFYRSSYNRYGSVDNEYLRKLEKGICISYEDACLFVYMKGLLEGFPYNSSILQVVIDEAQDYTILQYKILSKIFKKASFTILGDVNQTINPYYKYDSLERLCDIFSGKAKYLELSKTYRSSENIIKYINKILGLSHVVAIRKGDNKEVIVRREDDNLRSMLVSDINMLLASSKSLAIISKDDVEAEYLYNMLKNDIDNIELLSSNTVKFNRNLVIVPSYVAKGLEFDSVIVYTKKDNSYRSEEKYLYYVACSRAQHQLIVYNN